MSYFNVKMYRVWFRLGSAADRNGEPYTLSHQSNWISRILRIEEVKGKKEERIEKMEKNRDKWEGRKK